MNKITIVAKNKSTYFIRRCLEERGNDVELFDPWSDFTFPETDKYVIRTTGGEGNDLDLLLLQTKAPEALINPLVVHARFRTLLSQFQWLEEENFPLLPWIAVKGADLVTLEKFFRLYPRLELLSGAEVTQAEVFTWEQFRSWHKKHLVGSNQVLVPFNPGADIYEVFFLNEERLVLKARSGRKVLSDLPEAFAPFVSEVWKKSGALYGMLTLTLQDDRPFVRGINLVPELEELETITGKNLIATFLCSLVG